MFVLTLKLEDPNGTLSRLNLLSKLSFSEETWWGTQQRLHKFIKDKVASIKRHSVAKSTYQWRKAKAARGATVPTYLGETSRVLLSNRVGMRTGTLLGDMADFLLPGIYEAVSVNEEGTNNGMYFYMVNVEAFERKYPARFEAYLTRRGIISKDESLAGVSDSQGHSLLDVLSESVVNELTALWYSNVG